MISGLVSPKNPYRDVMKDYGVFVVNVFSLPDDVVDRLTSAFGQAVSQVSVWTANK